MPSQSSIPENSRIPPPEPIPLPIPDFRYSRTPDRNHWSTFL